jgi:hypothetical protein
MPAKRPRRGQILPSTGRRAVPVPSFMTRSRRSATRFWNIQPRPIRRLFAFESKSILGVAAFIAIVLVVSWVVSSVMNLLHPAH